MAWIGRVLSPCLVTGRDVVMFDKRLATALGSSDLAAVVSAVHRWTRFNQKQEKNRRDKQYWAYNSYAGWQAQEFPWAGETTVKRWFLKLEKMGILVSAQYGAKKGDMRKWYRVDYAALRQIAPAAILSGGQTRVDSPSGQSGLMVGPKWPATTRESQTESTKTSLHTTATTPAAGAVPTPDLDLGLNESKKPANSPQISREILHLPRLTARKAGELVEKYGESRVLAVVRYAMGAKNLNNPAGFVIAELREDKLGLREDTTVGGSDEALTGDSYVTGKYADFINH